MGCLNSSFNRIEVHYLFNPNDILYLTQSWSIIKTHDLTKFAHEVLVRAINQSPSLRQFWTSKIQIDGNNFDYSQSESCLRTDLSWHMELREHSVQFISIFDQLLSVINDEHRLNTQIQSLNLPENISLLEYESLLIMKQSILEILRERFQKFQYDFTDYHEQAWNKFLTFILKHILGKDNTSRGLTQIIISTATT